MIRRLSYALVCLNFLIPYGFGTNLFSQTFQKADLNFESPLGLIMVQGSGTNGISLADYNLDGTLDIYFVVRDSAWGGDARTWNRLFSYENGSYIDKTNTTNLKGISQTRWSEMGYNIGASWGDYNNDGYPDLFLSYTGKDQLFRNNGDGTFSNVSSTAGITGLETQLSSHGLWWDFDKDGDLDLYVTVRKDVALQNKDSKNRMYENLGDDVFQDVSEESGLNDPRLSYMAVSFDANNDGHLDIYVANDFGPNSLFLNHGDKTFSRDTLNLFGLNDIGEGIGISLADVDRNGFIDIYVTNVTTDGNVEAQRNPLFLNNGNNYFHNISENAGTILGGWGWGTSFLDFDNDGFEDLFISNGYFLDEYNNYLYANQGSENAPLFENIAEKEGVADSMVSRSHVAFDQNADGFLDILVSNFYTQPILYHNTLTSGNWLKIELDGVSSNRNGFGSKLKVFYQGEVQTKFHHGAQFFGQNILPVHVGLGNATMIDSLQVHWLNGAIDRFYDLDVNQTLKIREGGFTTSNEHEPEHTKAQKLTLFGNYPNPFNSTTVVQFQTYKPEKVTLSLFNSIGQRVFQTSKNYASGNHSLSLTINNLNSGVYFYQLSSTSGTSTFGKMLLLK